MQPTVMLIQVKSPFVFLLLKYVFVPSARRVPRGAQLVFVVSIKHLLKGNVCGGTLERNENDLVVTTEASMPKNTFPF